MRIILANDYAYPNGGASQVALSQAADLVKRGHEVVLFAGMLSADDPGTPGMIRHPELGLPVYITGQWDLRGNPSKISAFAQGLWNRDIRFALKKVIASMSGPPDVLLLHTWVKTLSPSIFHAAAAEAIPVVVMLHDYFIGCPNGAYQDFVQGEHCSRKPLSLSCVVANCDRTSRLEKYWRVARQFITRDFARVMSRMDAVIYVSEYQASIIRPWLPAHLPQFVLPNRVTDPGDERRVDASGNRLFVYLGRLAKDKGVAELAKAARDADVPLLYIGDGEERVTIKRIYPQAEIAGWKSREEIYELLRDARALVAPSLWHETFGLSVYEAASLGVPAVIPQDCAMKDFVIHGENGIQYATQDALKEALLELKWDDALVARLGREARNSFNKFKKTNESYYLELERVLELAG